MNTLNNIIKKISVKEELAKHQVELALVDELQKLKDTYSKIAIDALKTKVSIQNNIKELLIQLEKAKEAKDTAIQKNETIKSAAKNIGVEVPSISKEVDKAENFGIERLIQWANNANK